MMDDRACRVLADLRMDACVHMHRPPGGTGAGRTMICYGGQISNVLDA